MNTTLMILEIAVVLAGLGILLLDLWTPREDKRALGYVAAAAVGLVLVRSCFMEFPEPAFAFNGMFVVDAFALFFKRFFLVAAILILVLAVDFSDRIEGGIAEFYALVLFALAGMMFAASANDFILVFVALELITVTFYVLTSFQRTRLLSLEAGVKYLILGALASGFMIFGIALIFGAANTTNFGEILIRGAEVTESRLFLLGLLMVLVGLGFKIAAFPFQIWAPDVYQGSPIPTTAFLAVGSKAAGIVLLLRVLFGGAPAVAAQWHLVLVVISAVTILYGNLCAIPQRNLKRLLGYSSIANAGYLLIGVAAGDDAGVAAVLYYLAGYLFTVIAAFTVLSVVTRNSDSEDVTVLAGLGERSPFLAVALTCAMVSLAGIPPLAGFFGKFLLLKAALGQGAGESAYYVLVGIAVVGVVISLYYYLGVVRAIFWSREPADLSPLPVPGMIRVSLGICVVAMVWLGTCPGLWLRAAEQAARALKG